MIDKNDVKMPVPKKDLDFKDNEKIAQIEELEEARLRLDNAPDDEPLGSVVNGIGYGALATGGVLN